MAQTFKDIRRKDWAKQQSKLNHRLPLTLIKTWPKHNRQQAKRPLTPFDVTPDYYMHDDVDYTDDLTSTSGESHGMKPTNLKMLDSGGDFMPSTSDLDCYKLQQSNNDNNCLSPQRMGHVLTEIAPCNVMTPSIRLRHLSQGKSRRYELPPDSRANYLADDDAFDSNSNSSVLLDEFGAYCDLFFDHASEKFDPIDPVRRCLGPEPYPRNVYAARRRTSTVVERTFEKPDSSKAENAVVVELGNLMSQMDDDPPLQCPPRKPRTSSPKEFSMIINTPAPSLQSPKTVRVDTREFEPSSVGSWSNGNLSAKRAVFDPHNEEDPFHIDEEINIDLETRSSSIFSFDQSTTLNTEDTEQLKSYPSAFGSNGNKSGVPKSGSSSDDSSESRHSGFLSSKLRRWRRDRNQRTRALTRCDTIRHNGEKSDQGSSGNSIELEYIDYPSTMPLTDEKDLMTMLDDAIAQASGDDELDDNEPLHSFAEKKDESEAESAKISADDSKEAASDPFDSPQTPPIFEQHRPLRVFKFRDTIRKMKQVSSRKKIRLHDKDSVESFNNLPSAGKQVETTRSCKNKRARLWTIRNRLRK